ncbi:MAG: amidohydrolase family protein [Chlorobi bacterium]|nr:amidohydrolase family protein [Chlorobiota bacterium]MBX7217997.1 amidohydrolase family protein [Candidatus Kapabacteria bacterium]
MIRASFLLALFFAAPLLFAQPGGENNEKPEVGPVTRTFVIRNARIVQGPGRVIERGAVLIRDGVIAAVGTSIPIPFDAEIIEGDSMTVYAGFIDGMSNAGVAKPKEEPKYDRVPRPGDPPNARAGIQPERDVRDLLSSTDPLLDSLRRAGFTVAQTVPRGQMLPGTGAIISLGGDQPSGMVIRGNSALFAQFVPAENDVYPATTFAIMAKWRNLFTNAKQRHAQGETYGKNPNGIERPAWDATTAAFFPVVDGQQPVLFRVEDPLEVRRALHLQRDLGFRLMLAGLKEGWDVEEVLKSSNLPLFLSLDFPEPPAEKEDDTTAAADSLAAARPPNTEASIGTSIGTSIAPLHRTERPGDVRAEQQMLKTKQASSRATFYANAGRLHRAGVKFGFSTLGSSAGKLRQNVRTAIQHGLPEDAALAALTTEPARMLGLERSLGTVEQGKIANLVVTKGSWFAKESTVRYVFVDGRKYEYKPPKEKKQEKDQGKEKNDSATQLANAPIGDTLMRNPALALRQQASQRGNLLVRNGTLLTITNGTLERTDILVQNGIITKIGAGLTAPAGTDTIDATGQFVMPGIIDAHSHIATTDVNEWTNPVTAEVAIGDVIDPYDISIYRALAGGKTIAHVMHGSANAIGGQCQTMKMRYGTTDPEGLVMENAPRTIKFALGENPTRVHGRGFNVRPATRMGVEQVIRDAFTQAQRYMAAKESHENGGDQRTTPPPYDLRLETLAAVLRGEILVHCHSYRADEILMLMRVFRDFGIKKLTFQHVNEGFKIAPELADFGAMASVFADWWAYKFEVYYSTAYNAAILTRNNVTTSINSDSPELDRHLNHEAAKTMRYGGLTRDEALALITINPAKQLGIEKRVGSIEVGKEADLAIFNAHPLSVYSICQKTVVDGVVRFDRDRDPDDMRLRIDPKTPIETSTIFHQHEDFCMKGTEGLWELMVGE